MLDAIGSDPQLSTLRELARRELAAGILPFWERHAFEESGALRGAVTDSLAYVDHPPRHAVLAARILWTFSAAAQALPEDRDRYLATARVAHDLLVGAMWDHQHGGVFWSLHPDGSVADNRKHTYAQAFAVYALACWSRATGDADALERAEWLANALDVSARDREFGGYAEALARDWTPTERTALSEADPDVPKSMNTNLHVMEALAELLRASSSPTVREALETLLRTVLDSIVARRPFAHCGLYFDESWERRSDGVSYGHDIEASWLLWDAYEALAAHGVDDPDLEWSAREAALDLAQAVRAHGLAEDGAVLYAGDVRGPIDHDRHWWPQAEGVVGWLNAYQLEGRVEDRAAAIRVWDFIERHVIDREGGEWFARLDEHNQPRSGAPGDVKLGPWKCPYHNARACLEVLRRIAPVEVTVAG